MSYSTTVPVLYLVKTHQGAETSEYLEEGLRKLSTPMQHATDFGGHYAGSNGRLRLGAF